MKKSVKIWLWVATSLMLVGCVVFGGVMTFLGWNFTQLSTSKYETNNYEINESFTGISISTDVAEITFLTSEDQKCRIECYEQSRSKHSVAVKEGTLAVEMVDTRKWYDHVGMNFSKPSIKIYMPQGEYGVLLIRSDTGDVKIPKAFKFASMDIETTTGAVTSNASAHGLMKIKASTGKIHLEGINAGAIDVSVTTGKVKMLGAICKGDVSIGVSTGATELADVTCQNFITTGNTGSLSLKKVTAVQRFSIERSTGNVWFEASDAAEIFVKTNTGSVKGSLLTEKVFIPKTSTGRVDVPDTVEGGRCEIKTTTGDIIVNIQR